MSTPARWWMDVHSDEADDCIVGASEQLPVRISGDWVKRMFTIVRVDRLRNRVLLEEEPC